MIYYLLYIFLGSLCIANTYIKRDQKSYLLYIGSAVILLFQGLRWKTGTDWIPYYEEFINVNHPMWKDDFEFGYRFLNSAIRRLTESYTVFLIIECGLNLYFIIFFIKRMKTSNPCLVLLYLFVIGLFPIRYTLASNMILCSYIYILERRILPFCLFVFGAFLIHRSAIIFLPMYFICGREYSFKLLFSIYVLAIVLGILAEYTFGNLLQVATVMYGFADSTVQGKMQAYISGDIPDRMKMTPIRFLMSLINSTFFILFFYYFKKKYFSSNRLYSLLLTLYIFGISLNRIFLQTIPDMARITSFFTGGFIVMVIMIITLLRKDLRTLSIVGVIVYLFLSYNSTVNGFYKDLFVPYYTIFENPMRSMY